MVPPHCVFRGVHNMATIHLADLSKDGQSGAWNLCCGPKGYVTGDIFIDILQDLVTFIETNNVPWPIILWIDGASPHLSLGMAEFCIANGIQLLLFKPNSTHICQPLDLTFMSSLKAGLRKRIGLWQHENIGAALTKYSIVPLIHDVTEQILKNKPEVIPNEFRWSGLYTWDPSAPDKAKMIPSKVFAPPSKVSAGPEAASAAQEGARQEDDTRNSQQEPRVEQQLVAGLWPEILPSGGISLYAEQDGPR